MARARIVLLSVLGTVACGAPPPPTPAPAAATVAPSTEPTLEGARWYLSRDGRVEWELRGTSERIQMWALDQEVPLHVLRVQDRGPGWVALATAGPHSPEVRVLWLRPLASGPGWWVMGTEAEEEGLSELLSHRLAEVPEALRGERWLIPRAAPAPRAPPPTGVYPPRHILGGLPRAGRGLLVDPVTGAPWRSISSPVRVHIGPASWRIETVAELPLAVSGGRTSDETLLFTGAGRTIALESWRRLGEDVYVARGLTRDHPTALSVSDPGVRGAAAQSPPAGPVPPELRGDWVVATARSARARLTLGAASFELVSADGARHRGTARWTRTGELQLSGERSSEGGQLALRRVGDAAWFAVGSRDLGFPPRDRSRPPVISTGEVTAGALLHRTAPPPFSPQARLAADLERFCERGARSPREVLRSPWGLVFVRTLGPPDGAASAFARWSDRFGIGLDCPALTRAASLDPCTPAPPLPPLDGSPTCPEGTVLHAPSADRQDCFRIVDDVPHGPFRRLRGQEIVDGCHRSGALHGQRTVRGRDGRVLERSEWSDGRPADAEEE